MKILMVSGTFPPRKFGGVTAVSFNLAKELVKRRHEVTIYTTDVGDNFYSRLGIKNLKAIDNIKVWYFRNLSNSLAFKQRLYLPFGMVTQTKKELINFDIIHLHEYRSFQNLIIHYYAKKYSIPYVLQAHGSVLPFLQKQCLKKIFDSFFGYNILKNASKVIALNETESSQYLKMGVSPDKIEIVSNGIEISDYVNFSKEGIFRDKYSISETDHIVLYVGRLHRSKGIDVLVKSYSIMIKNLPNSKLVLMGPDDGFRGDLEILCENLAIKEKVLFTGFVDPDIKMAALMDSDVFVTPSFTGFPVSFLEACVFGLPIITTTKGDDLNWIHNRIGYVVSYDPGELSNAILDILSNEVIKQKFGDEAKKLAETTFTMDCFISKIERIYQKSVANNLK